jgi:branched-chain amino acid transport system ATP-binding protein
MRAFLEANGLEAYYGWTKVLHGLDLSVPEGKVTALLGANGAGKTTTLRALCGMTTVKGQIFYDGQRIDGKPTEEIVRLGVAHVPEGRGTFANLTVFENLLLGAYTRSDRAKVAEDLDRVYHYFPVLKERRTSQAGLLSGGEQQMLAVARGLMLRPRLLLLDEPSLGLAPIMVAELFRAVRTINQTEGVTVLLAEQNASAALDVAHHVYLVETGRIVTGGPAEVLRGDDAIRRSYLGY